MNKAEARQKDSILRYLIGNDQPSENEDTSNLGDIVNHTGIDWDTTALYCQQMKREGVLETFGDDLHYSASVEGIAFYSQGGYIRNRNAQKPLFYFPSSGPWVRDLLLGIIGAFFGAVIALEGRSLLFEKFPYLRTKTAS